jgi:hypothetical protein
MDEHRRSSKPKPYQVKTIIADYPEVIAQDGDPVGSFRLSYEHRIETGDAHPVIARDYCRSPKEQTALLQKVNQMLHDKVIRPSSSPWKSPVVLIPK